MCEDADIDEWTPYYFINIARFPWIDPNEPTYGVMEYCESCRETRIRQVYPREMEFVVNEQDTSGSPELSTGDKEEIPGSDQLTDGETGLDLDSPGDV